MNLKDRIIEISKKYHLAHVGSNLTAVNIIDSIYSKMNYRDKFILSSGHAGIALYTVLEKYSGLNAEEIFLKHGIHATRCEECEIVCSTGSLGNGLPIALGMALADRTRDVYCLISDGECMEGSIWETLRLANKFKANNLKVYVNANGYGGLDTIHRYDLEDKLKAFFPSIKVIWTKSESIEDHYKVL